MNFSYLPLLTDASSATDLMNNPMGFGERVLMGLQVMLFGMAVVFSVLILLWGILELFRVIFYEIPKKKAESAKPAEPETPAPAPVEEPVETVEETDDAEIVAAITAAISVVMDKPQTSFRVVSFRRTASK